MAAVVICDQPSVHRPVLAQRVASLPRVDRVDVVDDLDALDELLSHKQADLVFLASNFDESASAPAISRLRSKSPGLLMLLLTMGTDPDDIVAGLGAGAVGYLARDAAMPELAAAIALLPLRGGPDAVSARDEPSQGTGEGELTDREMEVLQGMSRGRSNSQIGEDLFLSEDTIKTHARRLFRKMRVNDRAHAVAEGFRRGLLG